MPAPSRELMISRKDINLPPRITSGCLNLLAYVKRCHQEQASSTRVELRKPNNKSLCMSIVFGVALMWHYIRALFWENPRSIDVLLEDLTTACIFRKDTW